MSSVGDSDPGNKSGPPNNDALALIESLGQKRVHLASIPAAGGAPCGAYFSPADKERIKQWLERAQQAKAGCYYTPGLIRDGFNGDKPSKADILGSEWIYVDCDPDGDSYAEGRRRVEAQAANLLQGHGPPSMQVDTGNGFQHLWRLNEPIFDAREFEGITDSLAAYLGGDSTSNIDRLLRVPGTTNFPSPKKLKRGYPETPRWSRIVRCTDDTYTPAEILEAHLGPALSRWMPKSEELRGLWRGKRGNGQRDTSGSGNDFQVARCLKGLRVSREDFDTILMQFPHGQEKDSRTLDRLWDNAKGAKPQAEKPEHPDGLIANKDGTPKLIMHNAALLLEELPELQDLLSYNEFTNRVMLDRLVPEAGKECRQPNDFMRRNITDQDVLQIMRFLETSHLPGIKKTLVYDAVELVAAKNKFHPVRDYLDDLTWDRERRLDIFLQEYFGVKADTDWEAKYLSAVGARTLIQAVSRIYYPGCKADSVLILQGPQGIGKSTAIRTLFGDDFFTDSLPHDLGAKDAKDHLLGSWGIELPELSQMRKSDVESIKAFISRQEERYRPAYGRNEVNFPRQCVFLGTTNAAQFLRDETGNRRFWPVTVTKVNTDALARERDQFWAEAKHRLNTGESYWIDEGSEPRLAQVARDATDERIIENPYLGILARYLEDKTNQEVNHEQIFEHLDINTDRRRAQAPDVSQAMTTLGWKPNKSKRNKKWHYAG